MNDTELEDARLLGRAVTDPAPPKRLSLGEEFHAGQILVKATVVTLDRIRLALAAEKLPQFEQGLAAAIAYVKDAGRLVDRASNLAGAELALRLEQSLPGHPEKEERPL